MSDEAKNIEKIDETLWIRVSGCDSQDYLVGNSHTFFGRMSAYCPTNGIHYSVSLSEIEEMSPEARRWVAGFLAGNEPRPEDMFGQAIHDAHDSDPRWRRWKDAIADFRHSGSWPHADWGHLIPFPPDTSLPPLVWKMVSTVHAVCEGCGETTRGFPRSSPARCGSGLSTATARRQRRGAD